MFNFIKQPIHSLATYLKRSLRPKPHFDFESLYIHDIAQAEAFINNNPDLIDAPITLPIRQKWNWITFGLGEYYREQGHLKKAAHFPYLPHRARLNGRSCNGGRWSYI